MRGEERRGVGEWRESPSSDFHFSNNPETTQHDDST